MTGTNFELWATEPLEDYLKIQYRIEETLFSGRSEFQKVDVVRTAGHGVMMFLDSLAMLSERDEFVYHDMICHPAMFIHPDPKKVLVIGGGDGGTAREVLRHKNVERAVMVEIDGMVVDVSRKFIPQTSCALDDPRLDLRIEDGVKYMAETDEKFDIIMVDSTDPIGPAQPLFGVDFYKNVHRVLADDGIVVSQGESTFYMVDEQRSILESMKACFPRVHLYNYSNLCYPGGLWNFAYASKGLHPLADFKPERIAASGLEFDYYNEKVHHAAFSLANFQLKKCGDLLSAL